ncbi:MAG: hypothetical protein JAZ17_09510 [Candidatus Thiodiazotropha endolucinida]|nr:hypothetical protein [Candidatus Thiodiazotropha endolucinida]
MTDDWLKKWTEKKIALALELERGQCNGSYAEAVIILCSVISAIAADIWPGEGLDRKRFVELLTEYSDESLHLKRVSIPLLISYLRKNGSTKEIEILTKRFMPSCHTLVITGDDVDKYEQEIFSVCPKLVLKTVRANSYANILYKEVRCGYVHQYTTGDRAESWPMSSKNEHGYVSYVNRADLPDRLIYFDTNWLVKVIHSIVNKLDDKINEINNKSFNNWWLK